MTAFRPWTNIEINRAVTLRRAGVSVRDIGNLLGRTSYSVSGLLQKQGVTLTEEQRSMVNSLVSGGSRAGREPAGHAFACERETRAATIRFEELFCDWADRHPGIEIFPYEAAA